MLERYNDLIAEASLQDKLESANWLRAEKQLHSFLEFYWVSYPVNGNYANARKYADALLAARKNSRNFNPVNWQGTGLWKSSLNGRMETVIPQKLSTEQMYSRFRARPGEQLSGIDLLKRLGAENNKKARFPSTSHMAAMPLYAQLEAKSNNQKAIKAWQTYVQSLPKEVRTQEKVYHRLTFPLLEELDGALLFESRLLDFMEKSEVSGIKRKLNAFLNAAGIGEPPSYYAILVGDGDDMGAAINDLKTVDKHRNFSTSLAEFSEDEQEIIERNDCAIVYAGGDDVLALLPLHKAVFATATLAQAFQNKMGGLTFSAGIAIVHHLEPLEDGLELARRAEQEAKAYIKKEKDEKESKKNALAIVLNKRSGAPRMVVGRWGEIDGRLTQFTNYYRKKELPHGLAYQLRDMFLHLGGQTAVKEARKRDDGSLDMLKNIFALEARRIVERKEIKRKEEKENAAKYIAEAIQQLDYKKNTIETLSSELIIAAQIAAVQEEIV